MEFQDLLDDLDGCINAPSHTFIEKYFGKAESASCTSTSIGRISSKAPDIPSTSTSSESFPEWFIKFATSERDQSRGSWSISAKDETHRERGLMDNCTQLSFILYDTQYKATKPEAAIQTVGLVCPSDANYRDGLITLCAFAQTVFYKQPTRLFLHGFYIRGSLVELCTFDRSGLCFSEVMDAKKDADQFMSLFLHYERMTNHELGMSSIFTTDDEGQYIVLDQTNGGNSKLYIDSDPVVTRQTLVGPATVVYRARLPGAESWSHAVKIKWPWARDRPESELLEIAMEKKAWGALRLDLYRELESTAHLRSGMVCCEQRRFPSNANAGDDDQGEDKKHTSSDAPSGIAHSTEETKRSFLNRTLTCIVTSPLGRALQTFQTRLELLEVLRDVIKCHKSLYMDAGLLHGDISPGNMIIADKPDAGQPRGMLIDLELATPRDPAPERDTSVICGTKSYMAIGYMQDEAKTYRHDLESFFYVFLWMVIGDRHGNVPEESRLRGWEDEGRSWFRLALQKLSDMEADHFQHIVDEIPPAFATLKGLAETLRALLFPVRDGKVSAGTDETAEGTDRLYDGILAAFDAAIASEE
ncbi:hypothetical protein LLEC1_01077 [Akanthomyces lecanii]|uniref:Protein kinase domain-containing protein n=1 Tax=Cordyceps confragosa TaxID=2714763 RepID=A0A179ICV4_CORDF|nr:hypothetical protein LLEC1_01077 [Akanthomyces lecanii]